MAGEKEPLLRSAGLVEDGRHLREQLAKVKVSNNANSRKQARFNWLFVKRFWLILRVAIPRVCSKSLLLLFALIMARAAEEYNYYQVGILPSQFYAALTSRDGSLFKETLWKMAIVVTALCICKSGGELMAGLVYVRWRATITRHLHSRYFSGITYYLLNTTDHRIDNPDQRITQDVDRFCDQVSQLLPKIILQPFLIIYYSYRTYVGLGWYGVLGIYVFFILSTVINKFIMGPIVSLVFQQEKLEGDFRFRHTQVRTNAESIAFYQGGNLEGKKADKCLRVLLRIQLGSVHWQFPLNYSVFMFDYVSTIISYSLIGVAVFTGKYDGMSSSDLASAVSKNSFFSLYLLNGFSTIVDTAVSFAEVAGFTHRIGELLEVLKTFEKAKKDQEERDQDNEGSHLSVSDVQSSSQSGLKEERCSINSSPSQPGQVLSVPGSTHQGLSSSVPPQCVDTAAVVESLSVSPPLSLRDPLIQDLSFKFVKGKNILILGETGSGKTAVLRVLRNLWKPLSGHAQLCGDGSHHYIMFIPQKTYLTAGSLADQVAYPESPKEESSDVMSNQDYSGQDRITAAIQMAGLVPLRDRLDGAYTPVTDNWYDIVSPGEAQKITFARLFYHQPPFAFLDEATSALTEDTESYFYSCLNQLGITVTSVGHRSTLIKFHHQILTINADSSWRLDAQNVYTS